MAGNIVRRHMVFSGIVQGVGFRWRARRAAELYGATGWVRNDPCGTVTMELQAAPEQIDAVVEAIARGSCIRIEGLDARDVPVERGERGFFFAD